MEKLSNLQVDYSLTLKVGASVLLCRNLDMSKKLYNGKLGVVESFKKLELENFYIPVVKFEEQSVPIEECAWTLEDNNGNIVASFHQIPLILAYGVTTHKTQGMTLKHAVVHGGFFDDGHAYVAFSRVKSLNGLFIKNDIPYNQIKVDGQILEFYKNNNLI